VPPSKPMGAAGSDLSPRSPPGGNPKTGEAQDPFETLRKATSETVEGSRRGLSGDEPRIRSCQDSPKKGSKMRLFCGTMSLSLDLEVSE
jgi:hypothetical protein